MWHLDVAGHTSFCHSATISTILHHFYMPVNSFPTIITTDSQSLSLILLLAIHSHSSLHDALNFWSQDHTAPFPLHFLITLVSQKCFADEPKLNQMLSKDGMFFLSSFASWFSTRSSFWSLTLLCSFILHPGLPQFPEKE